MPQLNEAKLTAMVEAARKEIVGDDTGFIIWLNGRNEDVFLDRLRTALTPFCMDEDKHKHRWRKSMTHGMLYCDKCNQCKPEGC